MEWFNAVDATYQAQLREINELNWQRFRSEMDVFRAEMDTRFATLRAEMDTRFATLRADIDARFAALRAELDVRFARVDTRLAQQETRLVRWMFLFWAGTTIPLAALIITVSGVFSR